ncbi:MAG: DUF262 domain-containing protein [Cyanobacteria bacterium P01_D01_bin.50]
MEYSTETLRAIFEADKNNKLVLPNFQRDFVWNKEKQTKLLASVLVGLPLGSILIVEGNKEDFVARNLGFTTNTEPKDECRFLLDGQQRLSCLKSIFDDLYLSYPWKSVWDKLYGQLRNRWFIKISPPNESSEDIWGWRTLNFIDNLNKYDPEKVQDFIVSHKILVKDENNLNASYHPAFSVLDESKVEITADAEKRTRIAEKFADEDLVPLFELYSNNTNNSIHYITLQKIARKRRDILKAKVRDKELLLEEILRHINPSVSSIEDSSELNDLWSELSSNWVSAVRNTLEKLLEQKFIETILPSDEIDRAASVFETINEGGTPLSNFDLIVAKSAAIGIESLTQVFKNYIGEEIDIPKPVSDDNGKWKMSDMQAIKENSIVRYVTDQFLNLLSILSYETALDNKIDDITVEYIKQAKILRLKPQQISANFSRTIKSLRKAFAFIQYRCGIVSVNDIKYKLMILPIAYLFSLEEPIEREKKEIINVKSFSESSQILERQESAINKQIWTNKKNLDKIEYWYWASLFSGRYKEKQNERCIQDAQSLYSWVIKDSFNPFESFYNSILEKAEYSDEATLLLEKEDFPPPKAIKDGILQYILSRIPKDFYLCSTNDDKSLIQKLKAWNIAKNNENIEVHHIIPLSSVTSVGESTKIIRKDGSHLLNSPLNLTYISKKSNREISDLSPTKYLKALTDATLTGHQISSNMIDSLKECPNKYEPEFYKKVLQDRFNTIKVSIKAHLENLLD